MNKLNDIEIKRENYESLPAGGYVVKILNVEEKEDKNWHRLEFSFDIIEGEYKDYFRNLFKSDTREDKRWRGVFNLNVPEESNQYYASQKKTFGNTIASIEESNNGYHWDWDEHKLKDKIVGAIFRDKEYEKKSTGEKRWITEAAYFIPAKEVREGKFKIPAPKPLKKDSTSAPIDQSMFTDVKKLEDELPF